MPYFNYKESSVDNLPDRVRAIVIGGGIHGAGAAHDLASRGWKDTLLIEKNEIGSETSSKSTKLLHGGLRYLKRISQFKMVMNSLSERRLLLELLPEIAHPVTLVYPVLKIGGMPSWIVRIGLFLYDFLAGNKGKQKHKILDDKDVDRLVPDLDKSRFSKFFSFWDGQTDDLALVIRVASSAVKLGATIAEGIVVSRVERSEDGWELEVFDKSGGKKTISALYIVNAAGPWANTLLQVSGIDPKLAGINNKGVHIIISKIVVKAGVFFESSDDGRIFFVLPWKGKTLIGTTEKIFSGDPDEQMPEQDEIDYLLKHTNQYFNKTIDHDDIEHKFSGLRWLAQEGGESISSTSREVVVTSHDSDRGFMLTIYGGKLTSYRTLSEEIGDEITRHFGAYKRSGTANKESWADVHEVIKPVQPIESRFK